MEETYEEKIAKKASERRGMENRERMEEMSLYGRDPYHKNIIKFGSYEELEKIQIETDKILKEVLAKMSSLQDQVSELIERQKIIKEALAINKPQNHVDRYKTRDAGNKLEER